MALLCEEQEFHGDLEREGALAAVISLALLEDVESQEYAAFCLAHLASNRDLQVKLVNLGAVRPLVTMLSSDAEPKHYAGLALLKLADNFENHLKIAEEGGIQALLRLGRTRTTDEQLQYKAALTLGQLASNAVKLVPSAGGTSSNIAPVSHEKMDSLAKTNTSANAYAGSGKLGASSSSSQSQSQSRVTERLRAQINAQKKAAQDSTLSFLDQSLQQTQEQRQLTQTVSMSASRAAGTTGLGDTRDLMASRSLDSANFLRAAAATTTMSDAVPAVKKLAPSTPLPSLRSNENDATPLHATFRLPPTK